MHRAKLLLASLLFKLKLKKIVDKNDPYIY